MNIHILVHNLSTCVVKATNENVHNLCSDDMHLYKIINDSIRPLCMWSICYRYIIAYIFNCEHTASRTQHNSPVCVMRLMVDHTAPDHIGELNNQACNKPQPTASNPGPEDSIGSYMYMYKFYTFNCVWLKTHGTQWSCIFTVIYSW